MAVITFPESLGVERASWAQQRNDIAFRSGFGAQAVEVSPPLWAVTLQAPPDLERRSGAWKALGLQLKGQTNQLALWNHARPVPAGTLRGSMTLGSGTAQGATSLSIATDHNLITRSTEFDLGPWTIFAGAVSVTPNTDLAPDGTMTADTVEDITGAHAGTMGQAIPGFSPSNIYTASIHVKKDSTPKATRFMELILIFYGSVTERHSVGLDTSTGEIAARYSATASRVSVSDSGSYWRISVTAQSIDPLNTTGRIDIAPAPGSGGLNSTANTATLGSCIVWGAQVDLGGLTDYGKTLLQGDLLGLGSGLTQQVVMVVADAYSASGRSITVQVEPPLRNAFSSGAAVTWDKPMALFRRVNSKFGWENARARVEGFSLDLIEDWRP